MKVVGFTGSPRKDSNTEIMVKEVLKGAREAGAETKVFNLSRMSITPCKACGYCKGHAGECATDDDMQIIYKEIKEADAFILGSPVYMWQMAAQAKLFTDRLYANFGTGFEEKYGKKDMALVFSQGKPDENMFREYFNYTRTMFNFLGYHVTDLLSSQGNMVPGEVKNKEYVMEKARKLGLELAKG
jgi:multimeric flavodoxin WrbA